MNIEQLRAALAAKLTAAKTLLEATMRTCQETIVRAATATEPEVRGRAMTDAETAACQAAYDEAKVLKAQLDRALNQDAMSTELNRMLGGLPEQRAAAGGQGADPAGIVRATRSLGAQFIADPAYRAFIQAGNHRRAGGWTGPTVELMATTFDTSAGSGGAFVQNDRQPGFLEIRFRRLVVADLIAPGTTTSNMIEYVKETAFTNAAAAVLQGGLKPESAMAFAVATSPVQKIAHWIPVTEEMLEDYAATQSLIDSRLRLGLALTEEDELLNGTGIAPHLLGLLKLPGLSADIPLVAPDTNFDVIFKQITHIATVAFAVPDGIVMNPANWASCQTAKNAQGNYIGSGPFASPQFPTMWGLPVAPTPAMAAGKALVGAFQTCAQLFRRGGVRVEATNSHQDFFVKNLVAIRAEERLALAAYREAAFGTVSALT